jgi:hypothetical protein
MARLADKARFADLRETAWQSATPSRSFELDLLTPHNSATSIVLPLLLVKSLRSTLMLVKSILPLLLVKSLPLLLVKSLPLLLVKSLRSTSSAKIQKQNDAAHKLHMRELVQKRHHPWPPCHSGSLPSFYSKEKERQSPLTPA